MRMRVAFGHEVRVPRDSGWHERALAHDFTEIVLGTAEVEPAPAYVATVPVVGPYGIVGGAVELERHEYFRSCRGLLHGMAAAHPLREGEPFGDYRQAPVVRTAAAPSLAQFEAAAQRRDWEKAFPFAWRPFDPSLAVRRHAAVSTRKPPKGAVRDAARDAARAAALAACCREADRYVLVGDKVMRVAGEPFWIVPARGPARVEAVCDHAGPVAARDALPFRADRLVEAVTAAADIHGCRRSEVIRVGRIEVGPAEEPSFRAGAFETVRRLQDFVDASHRLVPAASAAQARVWLSLRELTADLPDPKEMDAFTGAGPTSRLAEGTIAASAFLDEVRASGLVDDSRAIEAARVLRDLPQRLALIGDDDDGPARLTAAEDDALAALGASA